MFSVYNSETLSFPGVANQYSMAQRLEKEGVTELYPEHKLRNPVVHLMTVPLPPSCTSLVEADRLLLGLGRVGHAGGHLGVPGTVFIETNIIMGNKMHARLVFV